MTPRPRLVTPTSARLTPRLFASSPDAPHPPNPEILPMTQPDPFTAACPHYRAARRTAARPGALPSRWRVDPLRVVVMFLALLCMAIAGAAGYGLAELFVGAFQ